MAQANRITNKSANCHQEVISLEGVSFSFQQQSVISDLSFAVKERDFIGLIGTNGAGKTTLLRITPRA